MLAKYAQIAAAAMLSLALATPALAQRDPAYAAARAGGHVGEKMDGYLGLVGAGSPGLRAMVEDLNIKRKSLYSNQAQANHATVEEYAFTSGCLAIARTSPGEKYQGPDGSWLTRGSGPAQRDSRCP